MSRRILRACKYFRSLSLLLKPFFGQRTKLDMGRSLKCIRSGGLCIVGTQKMVY